MTDPTSNRPDPEKLEKPRDHEPNAAGLTTDGLGDAGRQALERERQARRDAERQAREAQQRLAALERKELLRAVAAEKGLTDEQAQFLRGNTRDELEAEAERLLAAFKRDDEPHARRRPREALKPGAVPSAEPKDYGKTADEIMRGW